ncbi:MFS transporter [Undibacterium parvum]|uniref:MFS transporter n=3 Tax=Undibacterium TaxID=401469 RepID=A0A6M4AA21_9BURK|nr:MFS transporter [Undibacterium parvum]QJQ07580.1 MFS transporter [Undibacterium piscinae]
MSGRSTRWAVFSLALSSLLAALGTSIANVALPNLALVFHTSFQQIQWVLLAYLLAITSVIVSIGSLGDLLGRRRLLLTGLALFTLASGLCASASSLGLLIFSRALQGLAAAVMMALSMALVAETVPKEKSGSAMGLLGSMSALGTALGPSLGGLLLAQFGWQALFWVQMPLGFLSLLLATRFLPLDGTRLKTDSTQFDPLGSLLLALTLGSFSLAMTIGRGNFGVSNVALLLLSLVGLQLFIQAERKARSPLLRLALFRDYRLSAGLTMSSLVSSVVMASLVIGPFYLSGALDLDITTVGLVMACGPIVAALVGVPAGSLVDRYGTQSISVAGLLFMGTGCLAMVLLPIALGVPAYLLSLAFITAGYAAFQAANNTAVMARARAEQSGLISGMLNLSRNLGLIIGASLMAAVFAFGAATQNLLLATPAALVRGLHMSFAFATALIFIALLIACVSHALRKK